MISSAINIILLVALAATSGAVILMYRRLQRFDALQNAAAKEFARASEAIDRAREAMGKMADDGGEMAVTLATRLNEARMMMNDIEDATIRTRDAYLEFKAFETATPPAPAAVPAPRPVVIEANASAAGEEPAAEKAEARAEEEPVTAGKSVPAAIRIRDAARARIAAAREKATETQAANRNAALRSPRPLQSVPGARPRPATPLASAASAQRATEADASAVRPASFGSLPAASTGPDASPLAAASDIRRPASSTAAERPAPTGPMMMLVKNREALARASEPKADGDDETKTQNSPEYEAAMAVMNGRQFTWSELATAAQRSA
ncbi:hypothetical protein [Acuticoccus sediminis]|uniref:hypothetical protein n=1 Tax=Acuticoccus sediminis TaxID=2184697 RepID=UPI001CFDDBE0|nr:hypothetical protein [Acuticoccus sediminis]